MADFTNFNDILKYLVGQNDIKAEVRIVFQPQPLVYGEMVLEYYDGADFIPGLRTISPISLWSPKFIPENAEPGPLEPYASVEVDITPAIFASTITLDGGNILNVTANLAITGNVDGLDTRFSFPLGIFCNQLICIVPAPYLAMIVITIKAI